MVKKHEAQVSREGASPTLLAQELTPELCEKSLEDAQKLLQKEHGRLLATFRDLDDILENPDKYPHLQVPDVWYVAFGSKSEWSGNILIPSICWRPDLKKFLRYRRWAVRSNSNDCMLLRNES